MKDIRHVWRRWIVASLLVLLASCGGGNGTSAPDATAPAASLVPGPVARLEVTPSAVVLTAAGQTRKLSVRAFDANDVEVPDPQLVFTSNRPGDVSASADGTLAASVAVGSALITVSSGPVSAAPLLATVAELAPGAIAVTDDQVVGAPEPVDPTAVAGPDFRYRVSLTGVGSPAPGTPIVGLGSQPVGGRVVSAVANGAQTDLVLEVGELSSLFSNLTIDLSYTPEQTLRFMQQAAGDHRKQAASNKRIAGLVKDFCKADVSGVPLSGDLSLKVDPSVAIDVSVDLKNATLQKLLIQAAGTVDAAGKVTLALGAALNGAVTCKVPLYKIPVPIFGVVSFFVAPVVPLEARLKLAATVSGNLFSVGADLTQRAEFAMGLLYTDADGLKPIDSLTLHEPKVKTTMNDPLESTVRAKASAFFGLGSGVALGNVIAALDVLDLNVGPEIEAKFGLPFDAAQDPIYKTGYELKGKVALGPGDQIKEALKKLLGSDKIVSFSVKLVEKSFAKSPQKSSLVADKDQYQAGQTVNFDLRLDPATVDFPVLGYNVGQLQVRRLDPATSTTTVVGTVQAAPGQTEFKLAWVADAPGSVVDKVTKNPNFYVFVVDGMLPLISATLPFEVGAVAATPTVPNSVVCDASKRFCAVTVGDIYLKYTQIGNIDVFVDENSVVYMAGWGNQGGWLGIYPGGPTYNSSACQSSRNPPRGAMPSRNGRFVLKDDIVAVWRILDYGASSCKQAKEYLLPSSTVSGQAITWQAVSDGDWAIGNVSAVGGKSTPVRIDLRTLTMDPVMPQYGTISGPPEVLAIEGIATDVNDSGTIVGVIQSGTPGVFAWQDGTLRNMGIPADALGCFHVTVNREGSLLAACSTAATGTYAYVRMTGSDSWTKVTSANGGPEPAFIYPGRVNSQGQVVAATIKNQQATDIVLWEAGNTVSLLANTGFDLGQPTQLYSLAAINDNGEMAIVAITDANPDPVNPVVHVYRVTPNPAYVP
jgi:hypothetical protein